MNEFFLRNVIEAALLAAGKPLQLADIGQLFDETLRPKTEDLRAAVDALAADYSNRGIEVKETAAGFRIQVRRELSAEISRLWPERPARYSRALLETLALIAYRQPITRAEIESVRGVAVNPNIIKTVIERNWVRVVGHRDVPGRPELLGTTREFLDYFGLRSLDELPPLAELKAMGDYNLQLDLPNGVAADGEVKPDVTAEIGEGGAPIAALLTSEAAANTDDASADATAALPDAADAIGDESVLAADVDPDATADVAADAGAAHAAASETDAAVGTAHTATADTDTAGAHADVGPGAQNSEAEADRTLSAGEVSHYTASESDDSDASNDVTSNESTDALDDSPDDDADEDELSADGHGSRELVAAPPDLDD